MHLIGLIKVVVGVSVPVLLGGGGGVVLHVENDSDDKVRELEGML